MALLNNLITVFCFVVVLPLIAFAYWFINNIGDLWGIIGGWFAFMMLYCFVFDPIRRRIKEKMAALETENPEKT